MFVFFIIIIIVQSEEQRKERLLKLKNEKKKEIWFESVIRHLWARPIRAPKLRINRPIDWGVMCQSHSGQISPFGQITKN